MQARLNFFELNSKATQKLVELGLVTKEGLSKTEIDLINIRASQLNGCTFCLDMHVKEAKLHNERELRLYHLPVWRESTLFSARERAILEWTELMTNITPKGISDEEYKRVSEHLSNKEMVDITFAIGVINTWNRLNVGFQNVHGAMDKMFGLDKAGLN